MKRHKFLIIFVAVILSAVTLAEPLALFFAKRQLKQVFKGSIVSIGSCVFKSASAIALRDIEIKHGSDYEIKIKEGRVHYTIFSLFKSTILSAQIEDGSIKVNLGKKNTVDLIMQYLREKATGKSLFRIKNVKVSDLRVNLKSADLNLQLTATLDIDPIKATINNVELKVASLGYRGVELSDGNLSAAQTSSDGKSYLSQINYNKFTMQGIEGRAGLKDKVLSLDSLCGRLFDGSVSGNAFLKLDKEIEYNFKLNFSNLDLERYVKDSELEKKLTLTGKLSGSLIIEGRGSEFKLISGDLSASGGGGILAVKDDKILKNLAQKSEQSLNILVEGFKDYHYNVGKMKLFLDKGNLVWQVNLEGEKGKRELTVVVHDFKLREEGL
jgi:hypothetical protein